MKRGVRNQSKGRMVAVLKASAVMVAK